MSVVTEVQNIKSLSRATGLPPYKISAVITAHKIPTTKVGNATCIVPSALAKLVRILKDLPGVSEEFVSSN